MLGKINYFDTHDLFTFLSEKEESIKYIKIINFTTTHFFNQSRENVLILKTRKKLTNGFSQSCISTIFILINNLHMKNELIFAS